MFQKTKTHLIIYSKPKFFQAHNIDGGLIEQITILNPPVQVFSINGCTDTEFAYITVDGSAGDSLGKNTDAFDIGSSTGITISTSSNSRLLTTIC
jgi:polygalacturonase